MVAINISFQFFARIEKIILSTYIPKIISNFIIDIFNDSKIKPVNGIVEIIYVFLTIFLYLLKCPQSLIL